MARRATYRKPRTSGPKKTKLPTAVPRVPQPLILPPGPPQPHPIDPIHTGQSALIEKQRQDLLTQLPYQQNQLASEYGFLPGSMTVDPNNPYSRASLLQRSYQQGQAGTTNSMAARGQLYSGATQRGLDEGTFNYSRNTDALQKAYQGSLNELEQKKSQGMFDLDQQQLDADTDRLGRAPDPVPGGPTQTDLERLFKIGASLQKPKKKSAQTWKYKRTSPSGQTRLG
jgi:hypothetical protein